MPGLTLAEGNPGAGTQRARRPGIDKRTVRRIGHVLFALFRFAFLLALSYIVLFPLIYMISNAFKPMAQIFDPTVIWVPKTLTLENMAIVFKAMRFFESLGVSLRVGVVSAFIESFTCAVIAYGFARFRFRENKLVFALVILTIIIPPQSVVIPLYLNFTRLDFFGLLGAIGHALGQEIRPNLLDSPLTFYIPSVLGVGVRSGLFIFIYRQFFRGLPKELEEAAWIDGAGPIKTFLRIVIPSSGVAFLTVILFAIIWHWNEYHLSVMYFNSEFPLSVSLSQIRNGLRLVTGFNEYGNPNQIRNLLMAGCLVFISPMLVLYLFMQKYFIRSIERVGIVG